MKITDLKAKLASLKEWFKENPNLPQEIDDLLLRRFLKCMYGDVEETKKLIELNYSLRNKHNHIFLDRDPDDEYVLRTRESTDMIPLPGLTPEGYKLLCFRLCDLDPRKMNSVEECKLFFMINDCRFTMADKVAEESNEQAKKKDVIDDMANGDVQIVDINGYTMSHIARISFLTLRIYMKYLQEAYPVRLRAMHIINCPSYLDKMIAIVKPFINDDVYKLIHFHTTGLDTLYKQVPRRMLPEEYGGKAGKIADLKSSWNRILKEKRDYLMDPMQWKVNQPQGRSRWLWF